MDGRHRGHPTLKPYAARGAAALATMLALLLLVGCIVHDSPAPGCIERVGPAPLGGCRGKTIIRDLRLEPQSDCLQMVVNNCNGGVVEVRNDCAAPLHFEGLIIPPQGTAALDGVAVEGGYILTETAGNFALTTPAHDLSLTFVGELGGSPITLTFTKTAPLCP